VGGLLFSRELGVRSLRLNPLVSIFFSRGLCTLPHRDQALYPAWIHTHLLGDLGRGHPRTPHMLDLFLEANLSFVLQDAPAFDNAFSLYIDIPERGARIIC
jgi:hypothetical protein